MTETRAEVSDAPGMGLRRVELIQLKMVLLAPMPRARVSMATKVKLGDLARRRRAKRRSLSNVAPVWLESQRMVKLLKDMRHEEEGGGQCRWSQGGDAWVPDIAPPPRTE